MFCRRPWAEASVVMYSSDIRAVRRRAICFAVASPGRLIATAMSISFAPPSQTAADTDSSGDLTPPLPSAILVPACPNHGQSHWQVARPARQPLVPIGTHDACQSTGKACSTSQMATQAKEKHFSFASKSRGLIPRCALPGQVSGNHAEWNPRDEG